MPHLGGHFNGPLALKLSVISGGITFALIYAGLPMMKEMFTTGVSLRIGFVYNRKKIVSNNERIKFLISNLNQPSLIDLQV